MPVIGMLLVCCWEAAAAARAPTPAAVAHTSHSTYFQVNTKHTRGAFSYCPAVLCMVHTQALVYAPERLLLV
jgi:hypothetical protein